MRIKSWAGLMLAAAIGAGFLAGCGNFWQAPSTTTTTTTTSTCTAAVTPTTTLTASSLSSGNFYIVNNPTLTTFQVVGYSIVSGVATQFTSAAALPGQAYAMAIDPVAGGYLFVSSSSGIFLYNIASNGALTLQNSSQAVELDATAYAIQVVSTSAGEWLLDASDSTAGQPYLYAFQLNSSSHLPTETTSNAPAVKLVTGGSVSPGGIAVSPDNTLVAVAEGSGGTRTFHFAAGNTGTTSPFGATAYTTSLKGSAALSVAFSPQTTYLYIGESADFTCTTNSGGLRIISITGGVPTSEPSASPYPSGGTGPHAILPSSNGYVYVANWQSAQTGNITAFLLGSGPSLTVQTNTVATGVEPSGIIEDPKSNYVLAVSNQGSTTFDAYTFDATTTGQLDTAISSSTGTGPVAIVAVP